MTSRADWNGPALFSYGFRPFFLAASVFALGVIPVWLLVWQGGITLGGPFNPVDWHVHEMLFGYAAAVFAGFLFTAIPNWTGRPPVNGWPLVVLSVVWLAGRLTAAGIPPLPPAWVMAIDCAFLLILLTMAGREVVDSRHWRSLLVMIPIGLFLTANVIFHIEAMGGGSAATAGRLGLAVVIFLITLIGGRIIPAFTRNWLAKRGETRMPATFGRFDGLCLATGAFALLLWAAAPHALLTGIALMAAGLLHLARLARWRGVATWPSPLLLMLHVAYLFIGAGLLANAAAAPGWLAPAAGIHLLGIGAVGGMTVSVMIRATRGHTGRNLVAGPWLTAAFALVVAAAIVRAAAGFLPAAIDSITVAAVLWTLGYGVLVAHLAPWVLRPSQTLQPAGPPSTPFAAPH